MRLLSVQNPWSSPSSREATPNPTACPTACSTTPGTSITATRPPTGWTETEALRCFCPPGDGRAFAWAPPLGDTTSSAPMGHLLLKEKAFGYFNTPLPSTLGAQQAAPLQRAIEKQRPAPSTAMCRLRDTTSSAPSGHLLLKEKAFGYLISLCLPL